MGYFHILMILCVYSNINSMKESSSKKNEPVKQTYPINIPHNKQQNTRYIIITPPDHLQFTNLSSILLENRRDSKR